HEGDLYPGPDRQQRSHGGVASRDSALHPSLERSATGGRGGSTVAGQERRMAPPPDKSRAAPPPLWGLAASPVLLVGPARALWATADRGWLAPFILWLGVICLGAWAVHRPSTPP